MNRSYRASGEEPTALWQVSVWFMVATLRCTVALTRCLETSHSFRNVSLQFDSARHVRAGYVVASKPARTGTCIPSARPQEMNTARLSDFIFSRVRDTSLDGRDKRT